MKYRILIAVLFLNFTFTIPSNAGGEAEYKLETEELLIITSEDKKEQLFNVEIARTPAELKYGLMYRNEMPRYHGMLFVFQAEQMRSFWMKNTFIPLDMIFIKKNGEIVNIEENTVPLDLSPRLSKGPSLAVLEINGGVSSVLGIKAGDIVYHSAFGNTDLIKDLKP